MLDDSVAKILAQAIVLNPETDSDSAQLSGFCSLDLAMPLHGCCPLTTDRDAGHLRSGETSADVNAVTPAMISLMQSSLLVQ